MRIKILKLDPCPHREIDLRKQLFHLLYTCPINKNELLNNLGLFFTRQNLARLLFLNEIYKMILNTHGVIIEFGVRWGQNLAFFSLLRSIYEPYNFNRKIIGFDTFEGFPEVTEKDGCDDCVKIGAYSVTKDYESYLTKIMDIHEMNAPLEHIKKYEIIKGDALETLPAFLNKNPHTIIALAYFDFDLYKPTKVCLENIKNHLTKGSILCFDELNFEKFPGETIAFQEVLGISNFSIKRFPFSPLQSFIIYE